MMTPRQRDALIFIQNYFEQNGCAPSLKEIIADLGLASKSSAFRLLSKLQEDGYVERTFQRERGIRILRLPPNMVDSTAAVRILRLLVDDYQAGRFPTSDRWQEAARILGQQKPQKPSRARA